MPSGTLCVVAELALTGIFGVQYLRLLSKVLVAQLVIAKEVDKNPSVPLSTGDCVGAQISMIIILWYKAVV